MKKENLKTLSFYLLPLFLLFISYSTAKAFVPPWISPQYENSIVGDMAGCGNVLNSIVVYNSSKTILTSLDCSTYYGSWVDVIGTALSTGYHIYYFEILSINVSPCVTLGYTDCLSTFGNGIVGEFCYDIDSGGAQCSAPTPSPIIGAFTSMTSSLTGSFFTVGETVLGVLAGLLSLGFGIARFRRYIKTTRA